MSCLLEKMNTWEKKKLASLNFKNFIIIVLNCWGRQTLSSFFVSFNHLVTHSLIFLTYKMWNFDSIIVLLVIVTKCHKRGSIQT